MIAIPDPAVELVDDPGEYAPGESEVEDLCAYCGGPSFEDCCEAGYAAHCTDQLFNMRQDSTGQLYWDFEADRLARVGDVKD